MAYEEGAFDISAASDSAVPLMQQCSNHACVTTHIFYVLPTALHQNDYGGEQSNFAER